MSSDYRPRSGGGSGRRRRGGRGRSGGHQGAGHRTHSNGTPATPPKKKNPIAKLFGWVFGKKTKPASKVERGAGSGSRPEFKEKAPRHDDRLRREERPKAEPVPQEIVSPKLYVGNLSYEAAESDLFDLFSKIGEVKNVEIAMDRHANRSKGFGFVEMQTLETAKEAAAKLNRTDFMGRQIVVSGAKLDKRPSTSPRETGESTPDATI